MCDPTTTLHAGEELLRELGKKEEQLPALDECQECAGTGLIYDMEGPGSRRSPCPCCKGRGGVRRGI